MTFGAPHRHFSVTDSTNTRARELAANGAPHGTVVTAAEQTEGRGRQGRAWTAPPGKALLYSAILRPLGERPLLPLAAALAVCEAAEELAADLPSDAVEPGGVRCSIKWPNDVLLDGRKLAGILIEARPQDDWAVIGVGLNIAIAPEEFPPELRARATSLAPTLGVTRRSAEEGPTRCTGDTGDGSKPGVTRRSSVRGLTRYTAVMSGRLERWIDALPEEILAAWGERDALRDREVAWDGGSGIADGVDDGGGLVVIVAGGDRIVLDAGEVHLSVA
jgi:BirA family transcriptional regulator, biotin operon repressor / biotin---[acetyl-CoA-carboxylase] ligase